MKATLPIILAFASVPLAVGAGRLRRQWEMPVGAVSALASVATLLWVRLSETENSWSIPWSHTWDLRLAIELDGLALVYGFLAGGIGAVVLFYAAGYLPHYLKEHSLGPKQRTAFYFWILLFMASMIGLSAAQDMILLYIFWELTTVSSFFLIGIDRRSAEARRAASTALWMTAVPSLGLLAGIFMLSREFGTFSIPDLMAVGPESQGDRRLALGLILVAAFAKSAQVPLHFWLPRAMAAPTPVSAYLHSAAMVAAGVFAVGRFYPLIETEPLLLDLLKAVGCLSLFTGSWLALRSDGLKQLLAYSTVAQYGYVILLYGWGGEAGAGGAAFYVLAHGFCKSGLFLCAGAVSQATGRDRLSQVGGMAAAQPLLAGATAICAAGLAGLPLTIGFFKDEAFFKAAGEGSAFWSVLAVLGAGMTFAYMGRFWFGIFLGNRTAPVHAPPRTMTLSVVILAVAVLLGGIWDKPAEKAAEEAAGTSLNREASFKVAYHLKANRENLMAGAAYLTGALLFFAWRSWGRAFSADARSLAERAFDASLRSIRRVSSAFYAIELHDLRHWIASIALATMLLLGVTLWGTWSFTILQPGEIHPRNLPLLVSLLLAAVAAGLVSMVRRHLHLVLALSVVNFSLVAAFAFWKAPDVALVAAALESVFTVLLLALLGLFPRGKLSETEEAITPKPQRWRNRLVAVIGTGVTFVAVWALLSTESRSSVGYEQLRLTDQAHAKDAVTAILADFRGLDTVGEVTVLVVAAVGVAHLFYRREA